jgi:Site-specific DNA methylase
LAFANEIRSELLEQAAGNNDSWDSETVPLAAPMQELAFDAWAMNRLPRVEVLEAGLPCSGASVAGRAKRGAGHPEAHPDVGHLVVPFLAIIAKVQPAVVLLENVKQYLTSASMCILRNQLRDFGYDLHEEVLQGADWNALEHRERMCMVAVTRGLSFDFAALVRPSIQERRIGDVLDPVSDDAPCWSRMDGLKAKQARWQAERDKSEGSLFAMQIVTAFDTKSPTITKGYSKVRSTDPKLQHPSNPDLLRQFTPAEHARIKGIPERLVAGLSATLAHELLGQSICYDPFRSVGRLIGRALKTSCEVVVAPLPAYLPGVAG